MLGQFHTWHVGNGDLRRIVNIYLKKQSVTYYVINIDKNWYGVVAEEASTRDYMFCCGLTKN